MDFIDQLKQFSERASEVRKHLSTEESTKNALVMPFFQLLGYDVFNPLEFRPECIADVGIKKGEKVDYAVYIDNKLCMLIEAKSVNENLSLHGSQLFRYFTTTKAKFGILTNGLKYCFYTDLDEANKMDCKPFLEFDLLDIKENLVPEIKKFAKSTFDVNVIFNTASELKYSYEIKKYLDQQFKEPSDDFTVHIVKSFYEGRMTQPVVEKFKPIVKKTINQYIVELMNDKITNALKVEKQATDVMQPVEIEVDNEPKIITTEEEMEAYYIIRSIVAESISSKRIQIRDTVNYCGVILDGKPNKWICRFKLSDKRKCIIFPIDGKEERIYIDQLEDIYQFRPRIAEIIKSLEA